MRGLLIAWALLLSVPAFAEGLAVWPSPRAIAPADDGTLAFDLVVVNATAETAREVVLADTLPPGTRLVSADPPPRLNGARLTWSLGDIAPSAHARVHVVLDGPDGGARAHATIGGLARSSTALPVVAADDPAFLAPTPDADAADPEILAAVANHRGDPDALLAQVRGLRYHAYRGSLRGARGTLWSEAGNALDRASLAIALLRAAGHPARYVGGTLVQADAATLVRSMIPPRTRALSAGPDPDAVVADALDPEAGGGALHPTFFARLQALGPAGVRDLLYPDPAADPALLAIAAEHDWVEVYRDGAWQVVDPTGHDFEPAAGAERRAEVLDERRHKATFVVHGETYNSLFGQILPRREVERLRATVPVVELVGRAAALNHRVDSTTHGGPLFSATSHRYQPVLLVDGVVRAEGPPWEEMISNFPGGSQLLIGLFLDVTLTSPGAEPVHTRHTLVDRYGAAIRDGAVGEVQIALDDDAGAAIHDADVATLHFAAGQTPQRVVSGMRPLLRTIRDRAALILPRGAALEGRDPATYTAADRRFVAEAERFPLTANHVVAETLGLRLLSVSDRFGEALAEGIGVVAYPDRPRLAVVTARYTAEGAAPSIDLALDRLHVVAPTHVGDEGARAFRSAWGLAQAALEGEVVGELTGREAIDLDTVFAAARAQGVPIRFVGEEGPRLLERTGMSANARARIAAAVRDRRFVLTPEREVLIDGAPHLVWLELDLETGDTQSVDARGGRPALVEYAIHFRYNGGYALGFMTGAINGWAQGIIEGVGRILDQLASKGGGGGGGGGAGGSKGYSQDDALKDLGKGLGKLVSGVHEPGIAEYIKGQRQGLKLGLDVARGYIDGVIAQLGGLDPPLPFGNADVPRPVRRPLSLHHREADLAPTAAPAAVPARVETAHARLEGDLALVVDGALVLPAGTLRGEGRLLDLDGMLLDEGDLVLDANAVTAQGTTTLAGPGRVARYGSLAGAVFTELEATVAGEIAFVDDEGEPRTLLSDAALLAAEGAVALPAAFEATADEATLWIGPEAFAGFAGVVTFDEELVIAGAATGRLAIDAPEALGVTRGEDGTLALAATSTAGGAHTWHARGPDGWKVTFADGGLRVRPAPEAAPGEYPVLTWIVNEDGTLGAGDATTVTLRGGAGIAISVAHAPLFTFLTRYGPAPLVMRAAVANRGDAAVDLPISATGPAGFEPHLAAPNLPLRSGEHGEVHLDLVPIGDPPPIGTPLTVRVRAGDAEAEATVPTPPLLGGDFTVAPARLRLVPGDRVQVRFESHARGNFAGDVTLEHDPNGPLRLEELPPTVGLTPGDAVALQATAVLAADAVPGVPYELLVRVRRAEYIVADLTLEALAVSAGAGDALGLATVAEELGDDTLVAVAEALADRVDDLHDRCEPLVRQALAQQLHVLSAELTDAVFADLATGLREIAFALDDDAVCAQLDGLVFTPLQALLAALPARLRALHEHGFLATLEPSFAVVTPGEPATFRLDLTKTGTRALRVALELLDAPGDAGGPLDVPLIVQDHPIVVRADMPGRHPFRVRITAVDAPAITRVVTGLVVVDAHPVEIVQVGADPPFALPGARLHPFVRLFNVANAPLDLEATYTVDRPDGSRLYVSPAPVPIRLGVGASIQRFPLGNFATLGEPAGLYTLGVTVLLGGVAVTEHTDQLFVGQPLRADITTEPLLLPPGDTEATVAITARRRPPPTLAGVRSPSTLELFTSTAAGPIGLAVVPDGTIYVSNFGQGRQIPQGSPGAGNSISRISPAGQVTHFATVPEAPTDMTLGPDGALYVSNAGNPERLTRVSLPDGMVRPYWDFRARPPVGQAVNNPLGVAFDSRGAAYVAELYDLVLFGFTQPGRTLYKVLPDADGDGTPDGVSVYSRNLDAPTRMIIDPRTDDLIVCDTGNDRIVRISTAPGVNTDPVALLAVDHPEGLAFDASHNLYVVKHDAGEVDVYPTAVANGRTAIAGQAMRWLDGLHTPITLVFAPDGSAITTNGDDQQVIRIRTNPVQPPPVIALTVAHRTEGAGADVDSATSDVAADAAWDVDGVTWRADLAAETLAGTFRYRHALPDMAPGERRAISAGTSVTYRVGAAEATVDLPPLLAIADHLVGLEPDRGTTPRESPVTMQVILRNHRAEPDTVALAVEGLPDGVGAQLAAQAVVPARGELRVPLTLAAGHDAEIGVRRFIVRATSAFGAVDRVVGELEVLGGLSVELVPHEQIAQWNQQVTFTVRVTNAGPESIFLQGETEGLAHVNQATGVLDDDWETAEARVGAIDARPGRTVERTFTVRPIGPPGRHAFRLRLWEFRDPEPQVVVYVSGVLIVEQGRAVSLTLDPPEVFAPADARRTVHAVLRNDGDDTASYTLTSDVPSNWVPALPPNPHVLAAGEVRRIPIVLTAGRSARNDDFTVVATDTEAPESRASATALLRVSPVAASLALVPPDVVAADGEARFEIRMARTAGAGVFELAVDGPVAFDAALSAARIDLSRNMNGSSTVTLRGLTGMTPGPWPVRWDPLESTCRHASLSIL